MTSIDFLKRAPRLWPAPAPRSGQLPWILAGLIVLCLIPRALMAWRSAAPCDDAYAYFAWSRALNEGDLDRAFSYLNLNIYPVILAAFNRAGIDWIIAAKVWGVLAACLTIVPLYRWVSRMFDVKTGLAAAFLFAIHPDAIELSIEPLREPTFWLFLFLGLDLAFLAVRTGRVRTFLFAGTALALSVHTRSEGWILALAVLGLATHRFLTRRESRGRVVLGTLIYLAVTPCLLLLVNVTLLRHYPHWEWGRLQHLQVAYDWLDHRMADTPSDASRNSAAASPAKPMVQPSGLPAEIPIGRPQASVGESLGTPYFKKMLHTLEPVNLVLALAGLGAWVFDRRRAAAGWVILAMCGVVFLAVWVRLSYYGDINGRYFLTATMLLLPFGAVGLRRALTSLRRALGRNRAPRAPRKAVAAGLLVVLTAVFWVDAIGTDHAGRRANAALGFWLRERYGPFEAVYAAPQSTSVAYYAKGTLPFIISYEKSVPKVELEPRAATAELVVLSSRYWPEDQHRRLLQEFSGLGWNRLAPETLPPATEPFVVLVRTPARPAAAN